MTSLPNVHYAESMKGALMSVSDRLLLRKRDIIETMNDELKNIVQVEYSKHRCLKKSSSTYSGQLLPIICSQRSRASMCKGPLTHSLHCSEFVELTLKQLHRASFEDYMGTVSMIFSINYNAKC